MTETLFFRHLSHDDKGTALLDAVAATRSREKSSDVYAVDPAAFSRVPGSPFAYWVSDRIRRLFVELPALEQEGRYLRVGAQTSDDFRFVRLWWEVVPGTILDVANAGTKDLRVFQRMCVQRTFEGKKWVPLVKGGAFSPYYANISTVINWGMDGKELKEWAGSLYNNSHWSRIIKSTDFYFRPGMTWPLRGVHLSTQCVPGGAIFSVAGKLATSDKAAELPSFVAMTNTRVFDFLVGLFAGKVGGVQYEVGLLGKVPMPEGIIRDDLHEATYDAIEAQRILKSSVEHSHGYLMPRILASASTSIESSMARWTATANAVQLTIDKSTSVIDDIASLLYGISREDLAATDTSMGIHDADPNEDEDIMEVDSRTLIDELVSYAAGCLVGRWDVRIAIDKSLAPELQGPFEPLPVSSPGMLIGTDGLLARPGGIVSEEWLRARPNAITLPEEGSVTNPTIPDREYPLRIDWDGIMVDDEGHSDDIVSRVRDVLALFWDDRTGEIEREAREYLGIDELRDYFRNPRKFWDAHVKRYSKSRRKAPIYWLLQSDTRNYAVWLYLHRLTGDTLHRVLNDFVNPKIVFEERQLIELAKAQAAAESDGNARDVRQYASKHETQEKLIEELRRFRAEIQRVVEIGYEPDLDDGVVLNIAPLHKLVPWKDAERYWKELLDGKYEWSTMSKRLRAAGLVRT